MPRRKDPNPTPIYFGVSMEAQAEQAQRLGHLFCVKIMIGHLFTRAGIESFLQEWDRQNATLKDIPAL